MSEWKEGAVKRRDIRRTAVPNIRPPGGGKRNTKKWCRGVVGREHKPVCVNYSDLKGSPTIYKGWKVLACDKCGKHLDYWWPYTSIFDPRQPPDWAK